MKKVLSIVMTLSMIFGLCMMPVYADKPYDAYPYAFEDFENGLNDGSVYCGNATTLTLSKNGVNDSAGAGYVVISGPNNSDLSVKTSFVMPKVGNLLNFSVWIKLDTEIKADAMSFILYGTVTVHRTSDDESLPEEKDVPAWKQITVNPAGLKYGEWAYVSTQSAWDGQMTCFPTVGYNGVESSSQTGKSSEIKNISHLSIRVGASGGTNDLVNAGDSTLRYYIDDISYNVISPNMQDESDGNIVTNGEFNNNTSGWSFDGPTTIVKDPDDPAPDGSEGYVKITPRTDSVFGNVSQPMRFQTNHLYKVSFWAKIIRTAKETTTGGVWFLIFGNNRISDTNGYNIDYPGYAMKDILTVGEWKKVEFYYLHEYKTFVDQPLNTGIRIFAGNDQHNRSDSDFAADSFQIIDLGAVSNGDFELGEGSVRRNNTVSVEQINYNVLGWNGQNAAVEQSSDIRPGSSGVSSMKVTALDNGGYAWQGIGLETNASYKLSFWAKGNGLGEEKPLTLVLDRAVSAPGGDSESYEVPDYQYIAGNNAVYNDAEYTDEIKASQEWKISDEWQYYECYYDNIFPLKDGISTPKDNIVPRLPFLSFNVDGNSVGTSFFVDDVKLERADKTMPIVSNVAIHGKVIPNNKVTVSYDYSGPEALGSVFVKALCEFENGKYTSLGSFSADESFEIPESAVGKKIVFELTPIDVQNNVGKPVLIEANEPADDWGVLYFDRITKTARAYSSFDTSANVVFASYKSGRLTGIEVQNVNLTANVKSEATINTLDISGADTVKVMLWNAIDGLKPISEPVIVDNTIPLPTTVHLLGDSLCVNYGTGSYPQQGWGYYIGNYLHETATVINHAQGGRTAETFYHDRWAGIKHNVKKGDYVFIAFGLNDFYRAPTYDTDSTKEEVYHKYLDLLCKEAREAGAEVVFTTITPNNPKTGKLASQENLTKWSGYIKEVAAQNNAVCLDINAVLRKIYFYDEALGRETEEKGVESYNQYFLSPAAMERFKEYPISDDMKNKAETYGDWTHVNEDGANLIAGVIAEELSKSESPLARYVLK